MNCAIFAGGEIKELGFINPDNIRNGFDMVICADSGYKYAVEIGIVPDIIVGDFDSYSGSLPENVRLYRSIPEKDDTDTMLAVKIAIESGCNDICLYGALGRRFDHTFANIQTLVYAYENNCNMSIIDSDNEIMIQGAECRHYNKRDGWYFSIFALTDTVFINEYNGVKYPLKNYTLKKSYPIGVSNEITESEAVLNVQSGIVLVVRSKM